MMKRRQFLTIAATVPALAVLPVAKQTEIIKQEWPKQPMMGWKNAYLEGWHFDKPIVGMRFENCTFQNCTADSYILERCEVVDCRFNNCKCQCGAVLDPIGYSAYFTHSDDAMGWFISSNGPAVYL